jgi:hypothetical protein
MTFTLKPHGAPTTIADCLPGPFKQLNGNGIGFKTEYRRIKTIGYNDERGRALIRYAMVNESDVYVLETGEVWWVGAKTREETEKQIVQPMIVVIA